MGKKELKRGMVDMLLTFTEKIPENSRNGGTIRIPTKAGYLCIVLYAEDILDIMHWRVEFLAANDTEEERIKRQLKIPNI